MIDTNEPASWRDLQNAVARILREAGVATTVEKVIPTARGNVSIDVWAHDSAATPAQTYLVECKKWRARVPQTVVHAFRTVVGDGARRNHDINPRDELCGRALRIDKCASHERQTAQRQA